MKHRRQSYTSTWLITLINVWKLCNKNLIMTRRYLVASIKKKSSSVAWNVPTRFIRKPQQTRWAVPAVLVSPSHGSYCYFHWLSHTPTPPSLFGLPGVICAGEELGERASETSQSKYCNSSGWEQGWSGKQESAGLPGLSSVSPHLLTGSPHKLIVV